ncbi:MAG: transglutaminase-like domain-containing protein [Candidatus Hydrogenedentes bacterium]|nr:transglutaminase-like domain-containing protein [Candidatus Hydrogenedentota bacterium]
MKRVLIMVGLLLFPRLLAAQNLDVTSLVGENWYGLYLNEQKAGYSFDSLTVQPDGSVVKVEDAHFKISMGAIQQDMRIYLKRTYAAGGDLVSIEQEMEDAAGPKKWEARVNGDVLLLTTSMAGTKTEERLPKPKESLKDALKQIELIRGGMTGQSVDYTVFEPMYKKEMSGASRVEAVEERVFDGVVTKVFKIGSTIKELGIRSTTYVTQDGTVLEDRVAEMLTMRLEPKEMAQDVNYSNDVIVSNAAPVDKPIENPRQRDSLALRIYGPITKDHIFNSDRQQFVEKDGYVEFHSKKVSISDTTEFPVKEPSVAEWIKPSLFIQSDDKRLVEKAREIVGNETNALAASGKLAKWVFDNVRTTYSAQLTNALEVLDLMQGDCTEHSVLFIGLARALGIPAREVAGLIYVDDVKPGFYFHQWAAVWVGKWIEVDPTFGQPIADATHIKLAEGDLFEQAKLIPVIGRLRVEVVDEPAVASREAK